MKEKFRSIVREALNMSEQCEIKDDEIRRIVFSKALDYLLSKQTEIGPSQFGTSSTNSIEGSGSSKNEQNNFWQLMSTVSGAEVGKLKDIYTLKDDQILLVMPNIEGITKAEQQQKLAVLVLFAYHEGLGEEWVSAIKLAEAAKHSNLYDTSKFSRNVRGTLFRTQGAKKGIKYRLSSAGIDTAKKILKA